MNGTSNCVHNHGQWEVIKFTQLIKDVKLNGSSDFHNKISIKHKIYINLH
jgi:hypothetical protein